MNLHFPELDVDRYKSNSQRIRVLSEGWVSEEMYCPVCGCKHLIHYGNNKPVADFFCEKCNEQFELKSKQGKIGNSILDGAYQTAVSRITSNTNPHLFVLSYYGKDIRDLIFVPKFFFTEKVIQRKTALSENAKRKGWEGSSILFGNIPSVGKIDVIRDGIERSQIRVLESYRMVERLSVSRADMRGWLMEVLKCVERIQSDVFSLEDIYAFESELQQLHPDNQHVPDKIRQQLQILRDRGFIEFLGRGVYRKLNIDR